MNNEESRQKSEYEKDVIKPDTNGNNDDSRYDASEDKPKDADNISEETNVDEPVRDMVILHRLIILIVLLVTLTGLILATINVYSSIKGKKIFNDYFSAQPIVYAKESGICFQNLGSPQSYGLSESDCEKLRVSDDGKRFFLLCNNELIYLNSNDINYNDFRSSVLKIDTCIDDFECSTNGRFAVYRKNSCLYACTPGNAPFLISENVTSDYLINSADNSILYKTNDSSLGIYNMISKENIFIKNVSEYELADGSSRKIYYISKNSLYFYEKNKQTILIHENVSRIFSSDSSVYAMIDRNNYFSLYSVSSTGLHLIETKTDSEPEIYKNFFIYKRINDIGTTSNIIVSGNRKLNRFVSGSAVSSISMSKDGKYLYALMRYGESQSSLMKFKLDDKGICERTMISESASAYTVFDNGSVIFENSYGTNLYHNNESTLITPYSLTNMQLCGNTIYAIENIEEQHLNLIRIKDGSVHLLDERVSPDYAAFSSSEIIYIKNNCLYSKYALNESILIDNNVKKLLKSDKTK